MIWNYKLFVKIVIYVDADFEDEINHKDDITVEVKSIRFDCKNCGDYIIIDDIPYSVTSK